MKEEKSCKIILIYNDQRFDEETEKQIKEYRDKVVDLELTYRPSIGENLSIIWPQGCPERIAQAFHRLSLNNIRIMQRVRWTHDYFASEIENNYPYLRAYFEAKSATLTIIYYAYGGTASLEQVLSTSYYSLMLAEEDDDTELSHVLRELDYSAEEQDAMFAEYLTNGYVDFSEFEQLLRRKNDEYRIDDINKHHREIWRKYHDDFTTSQEEFVDTQRNFIEKHVVDLHIRDVDAAVRFLKELDPNVDVEPLVSKSIERFAASVDRKTLRRNRLELSGISREVRDSIDEALAAKTQDYSIAELFVSLAGSDSWSPADIKHLLKYSEDDYFEWITTEDSVNVIDLLKEFLVRFATQNDDEKTVVERIRGSLERISGRSNIDRCRVKYLIDNKC